VLVLIFRSNQLH